MMLFFNRILGVLKTNNQPKNPNNVNQPLVEWKESFMRVASCRHSPVGFLFRLVCPSCYFDLKQLLGCTSCLTRIQANDF